MGSGVDSTYGEKDDGQRGEKHMGDMDNHYEKDMGSHMDSTYGEKDVY